MLAQDFRSSIEQDLGEKIRVATPVGGGCISEAYRLELYTGELLFLKFSGSPTEMFKKEAMGLNEIKKTESISVPVVKKISPNYLLLEYISPGRKISNFWEDFGIQFARMHKFHSEEFGFSEDNYIGLTPQINKKHSTWAEFYWENRLLYQWKLAQEKKNSSSEMNALFSKVEKSFSKILEGSEEKPSLLHGDLWNGNYLVGNEGKAFIFDPAAYYGHREADLAMTKLFGGFAPEFYEAYQDEYPLSEGWEYREDIYKLYHVMNHLNLFGSSYYGQAVQILRSYL